MSNTASESSPAASPDAAAVAAVAAPAVTAAPSTAKRSFAKDAASSTKQAGAKKKVATLTVDAAVDATTATATTASKKTGSKKRTKDVAAAAASDSTAATATTAPAAATTVPVKKERASKKVKVDAASIAAIAAPASAAAAAPSAAKRSRGPRAPKKSATDANADASAAAAAPAAATSAANASAPATAAAAAALGGVAAKPPGAIRYKVEDRVAAFRRALLHPYGTQVTSLDCAQAARDLEIATTNLSATMMQRFLSVLLAHDREMPKAARAATSRKNGPATLEKYYQRLLAECSTEECSVLHGAWLSHYKVKGSVSASELDADGFTPSADAEEAYVVYRVARAKGFAPLGLVSERGTKVDKADKTNKARVHLVSVDGPRVYVGAAMTMWNLPMSIFSCISKDTVLFPKKPRNGSSVAAAGAGTGAGAGAGATTAATDSGSSVTPATLSSA
jgi:hypothetical protein